MKSSQNFTIFFSVLLVLTIIIHLPLVSRGQSYAAWYNSAQQRIDTLRKGNFGINIVDKDGQAYTGPVAVRMAKHEFQFGIAFDFYEGNTTMGNVYSTNQTVQADADPEIYKTQRWGDFLAYALPAEIGKEYRLTLKFAEIVFSSAGTRLFDVFVESHPFLQDFNIFNEAGGQNIAVDKSYQFVAARNEISIEMKATNGLIAIMGIVLEELEQQDTLRINCGGPALTTADGNSYISETGYFDNEARPVATKEQWMKAAMYKYFNAGVSGNSFKWSGIQPQPTPPNYSNFDNAVRWTQKVGWDLRAHTLLWGGDDNHSMPGWVRNLPTPQHIIDTCEMRVTREVTRYRGIIKDYDVMNEPLTGHADWLRNTVGDSIIWDSFKWARAADPDAELYVNDYNVEYNWGQAMEYRDLVLEMLENEAPVTGVGMQAHFWDCCRPQVDELVRNVDIVAEAGLPIKFTEYDYGGNLSQAAQASDYIKVLTIAFSHPSIVGMFHWGLDDAGAWRENTGFFDTDLKPKLAADTLLYYTKTRWATNFDADIADGIVPDFSAYYGTYNVEVTFNDTVKVFSVPLLKAHADSVFTLYEDDAFLKGPQLILAELEGNNAVRLLFDKPIEANSVKRSDFKFFARPGIGVDEIQTEPGNPNSIIISLKSDVVMGSHISVSYFPGLLKATDGSKALAFGPEAIFNPDFTHIETTLAKANLFKVFPNPATTQLTISHPSARFTIAVYNNLGQQIHAEYSYAENFVMDVSDLKKGFYLIKMTDENNQVFVEKVIVK